MFRLLISIITILFTCAGQAKNSASFYQVDLIVFTHQNAYSLSADLSLASSISANTSQAIPLRTESKNSLTPYHLLPASSSQLRQEYWALHRKPQYRVLLHYTWLQPLNNQRPIMLPKTTKDGWQIEGTLRIRRSNYYLLDTELLFSAPSSQAAFVFSQKQRLKGGAIYYLDHPQAGMLIKVHQLA